MAAKRKRDADLSLAWHVEAFARSKRLPSLTKILGRETSEQTKVQTPAQMIAAMRAWVRATRR